MMFLVNDLQGDDGDGENDEGAEEEDAGDEQGDDDPDDRELDKYLALPQLAHAQDGKDTDIMEWWRVRQFDFSHLARMAR